MVHPVPAPVIRAGIQAGDLILAPVPFTEPGQAAGKVRPCLVIDAAHSLKEHRLTIAYGTTRLAIDGKVQPWEFMIRPEDGESTWMAAQLRSPTIFVFTRLFSIDAGRVRKVGHVHVALADRLGAAYTEAMKRHPAVTRIGGI